MNGTLASHRTLASLTLDDSKVLGNIKPRLNKTLEVNALQTNKFKTLNSSWTPLADKTANRTIFEQRVDLVSHWFDLWSDKQRKWFLLNILARCRPPQICFLEDTFENYGAAERKDFTRVLPKYLSIYILSFLSPKDLSRCAQVNSHWKFLSEQDEIWMPKCTRYGWYLQYAPSRRELGAWKAHFIECARSINAMTLGKQDAARIKEAWDNRELTEREKELTLQIRNRNQNASWENGEILSARRPWVPSSTKPVDLKKSDKLLFSNRFDKNEPTPDNPANAFYKTKFGLPLKSANFSLVTLNKSRSISNEALNEYRETLPFHFARMRDTYRSMRKSESDLFLPGKLSKESYDSYLNYKKSQSGTNFYEPMTTKLSIKLATGPFDTTRMEPKGEHVLFVSSKVPCHHLLLECIKSDVIAIPYDYENTNINSLGSLIDKALAGRLAETIGFFLHTDKPGQIPLTKDKSIYKVNLDVLEISQFLNHLLGKIILKEGKLDFFLPLGSSNDGLELVRKLSDVTGLCVRTPLGYLGNYKYTMGKWLNQKRDLNPTDEYFVQDKYNMWLSTCDVVLDAHDKIGDMIMNGYVNDINKKAVERIVGKLVYDTLSGTKFISDINVQTDLKHLIQNAATSDAHNIFSELYDQLHEYCSKHKIYHHHITQVSSSANGEPVTESSVVQSPSTPPQETTDLNKSLNSDMSLKQFLKYKSHAESVEPNMRTEVILELIQSEVSYKRHLEIIQKYYARPLRASYDSGQTIVSKTIIDLLFGDLAALYNISKDMVRDFNLRLKNWTHETCVVDIICQKLCQNIQLYVNYTNNHDSIINSIDKLVTSNPKFRGFLIKVDQSPLTEMMSIQELMCEPWKRTKEYLNLLSALQLHTPLEHPDQANISYAIDKMREFYLYVKKIQGRMEKRTKMIEIQRNVLNAPEIIKGGRYLVVQEKGILLNNLTFTYIKDITCFLFNNALLIAYRYKKHFPFIKYTEESLIFYDMTERLSDVNVTEVLDLKFVSNVVRIKTDENEYCVAFANPEIKFNFMNAFRLTRSQARL